MANTTAGTILPCKKGVWNPCQCLPRRAEPRCMPSMYVCKGFKQDIHIASLNGARDLQFLPFYFRALGRWCLLPVHLRSPFASYVKCNDLCSRQLVLRNAICTKNLRLHDVFTRYASRFLIPYIHTCANASSSIYRCHHVATIFNLISIMKNLYETRTLTHADEGS